MSEVGDDKIVEDRTYLARIHGSALRDGEWRDGMGNALIWDMGEPGADGIHTPTITRHTDDNLPGSLGEILTAAPGDLLIFTLKEQLGHEALSRLARMVVMATQPKKVDALIMDPRIEVRTPDKASALALRLVKQLREDGTAGPLVDALEHAVHDLTLAAVGYGEGDGA